MSTQPTRRDPWRWSALFLWCLFFLLGLWPELSFGALRTAGYVFSQNAIINSHHFITWCLTGFIVHFVYHRCIDTAMPPVEALGKSIQLGIVAFVAFVDMPLAQIPEIRAALDRTILSGMVLVKLLAWLYLFTLLIRYCWHQKPEIIAHSLSGLALTTPTQPKGSAAKERTGDGVTAAHSDYRPPVREQAD
ncbi:MAG: hypothetical protein L3K26_08920 [Candidatus Hydrogenedentes bacterium]|nr:hypothetical protein [Candidatus Hydrogenedentota bacterium]